MATRRRLSGCESEGDDSSDTQPELKRPRIAEETNDGGEEQQVNGDSTSNPLPCDDDGFQPGPQLNMVIGPNGTGKSTIVCAIALGLGGSPGLLGRAKNIAEFVKTGEDEAMIQIELKRTGGRRNIVIQRTIQKANNQSQWRLDGKMTPFNRILSAISDLNIQVDNLCQFLPQDKVAEFAQLTPSALLTKTQEAAGESDLSTWHQELIKWRNEEKDLQRESASDQERLKSLKDHNSHLERDVVKLRQKEMILKNIRLLEAKLPLARYNDANKDYEEAKETEQELRQKVRNLEDELGPIHSVITETEQAKNDAISESRQLENKMKTLQQSLIKITEEIERSSVLDSKITDYNVSKSELDGELDGWKRKRNANQRDIQHKSEEIKAANDILKRRFERLARNHEDTVVAQKWLHQNRDMFEGRVYGPIVLHINLKDQRYANLVEAMLGGARGPHLRTFVCEKEADYKKFTKEAVDNRRWRLTVAWPVDNEHRQQLQNSLRELEDIHKRNETEIKRITEEIRDLEQKISELHYERAGKKSARKTFYIALRSWEGQKLRLDGMKEELDVKRSTPESSEDQIEELKANMLSEALKRAQLSNQYNRTLAEFMKTVLERNVSQLRNIQTNGKFDAAKSYATNQTASLEEARQGYQQAAAVARQKKNRATVYKEEAAKAKRSLPAELRDEFEEIYQQWKDAGGAIDMTAVEIEDLIQSEKAKADTLRLTNPKALEQYEARQIQINTLSTKIDEDQASLNSLREQMQTTRFPKSAKDFQNRFKSVSVLEIGCAGEVCVSQSEDFDKWGIEIRVKFRDNEKLQLLTGQRQSGGERAVSTILYLMALQNLARSPFRVVDEINQGMDQRNERMIHELIVKGASMPGTPQYFLITPKLLPDLYYNEPKDA
ncbi:hypothetical protein BX666DRAFT_1876613 [Dichotomocladium elegans]|nr:hypothetical protein BX666DRAFT_1876613 [Dichotomocladium elegans]